MKGWKMPRERRRCVWASSGKTDGPGQNRVRFEILAAFPLGWEYSDSQSQ